MDMKPKYGSHCAILVAWLERKGVLLRPVNQRWVCTQDDKETHAPVAGHDLILLGAVFKRSRPTRTGIVASRQVRLMSIPIAA